MSSWRARGTVPYAECVRVGERKCVDLGWLLTGRRFDAESHDVVRESVPSYSRRPISDLPFSERLNRLTEASKLVSRVVERTGIAPPASAATKVVEFVFRYGADETMVEDLLRLLSGDATADQSGGNRR